MYCKIKFNLLIDVCGSIDMEKVVLHYSNTTSTVLVVVRSIMLYQ